MCEQVVSALAQLNTERTVVTSVSLIDILVKSYLQWSSALSTNMWMLVSFKMDLQKSRVRGGCYQQQEQEGETPHLAYLDTNKWRDQESSDLLPEWSRMRFYIYTIYKMHMRIFHLWTSILISWRGGTALGSPCFFWVLCIYMGAGKAMFLCVKPDHMCMWACVHWLDFNIKMPFWLQSIKTSEI